MLSRVHGPTSEFVQSRTCDVLGLHRACLHQEGLSSLERQDGLSLSRVSVDDLLKFSFLPIGLDAIQVGGRLHAVDHGTALRRRGRVRQVSSCCAMTTNHVLHT